MLATAPWRERLDHGNVRWKHHVGHRVWSSPTVQDDWIWFGSHSGHIVALREDKTQPASRRGRSEQ